MVYVSSGTGSNFLLFFSQKKTNCFVREDLTPFFRAPKPLPIHTESKEFCPQKRVSRVVKKALTSWSEGPQEKNVVHLSLDDRSTRQVDA